MYTSLNIKNNNRDSIIFTDTFSTESEKCTHNIHNFKLWYYKLFYKVMLQFRVLVSFHLTWLTFTYSRHDTTQELNFVSVASTVQTTTAAQNKRPYKLLDGTRGG
ncbi:voltage-dependent calcium channel gamma-7 subunit [Platysternon megacephalum]|uniref:Voltage-dependent calcium channel gamma-7 subunit n=1 Tax=Platysternon megacephalum TaxID=55544 RepID=A0A4D9DN22_9SAUR|nr:voltage-dependent calcium channel gamma-7 subunit [Platysternon megacephalum]